MRSKSQLASRQISNACKGFYAVKMLFFYSSIYESIYNFGDLKVSGILCNKKIIEWLQQRSPHRPALNPRAPSTREHHGSPATNPDQPDTQPPTRAAVPHTSKWISGTAGWGSIKATYSPGLLIAWPYRYRYGYIVSALYVQLCGDYAVC